jgi:exopolysaccharide biosynthesis protein
MKFSLTANKYSVSDSLDQWLSTFLMFLLFKTVPHIVLTSNHKIVLLLHHNSDFATVINCNVNN